MQDAVQLILSLVGVIGTCLAIYQWAVINESKKRKHELQFLLASLHQISLSKQMEWNNQISFLTTPQNEYELEILKLHIRARDNFNEFAGSITALESVIETDLSAGSAMLKKTIEQTRLNNELQTEHLKNPTHPKNQNKSVEHPTAEQNKTEKVA